MCQVKKNLMDLIIASQNCHVDNDLQVISFSNCPKNEARALCSIKKETAAIGDAWSCERSNSQSVLLIFFKLRHIIGPMNWKCSNWDGSPQNCTKEKVGSDTRSLSVWKPKTCFARHFQIYRHIIHVQMFYTKLKFLDKSHQNWSNSERREMDKLFRNLLWKGSMYLWLFILFLAFDLWGI